MVPFIQDNETKGLLLNARNITDRKLKEIKMKKQLMKFKIEEGIIYFINSKENISKITAINDLQKIGYKKYIISRNTEEHIKSWIKGTFEYRIFAEIKTNYLQKTQSLAKK